MIKIGITGNIGSGKSTVCNIFEALNIPVYCSDFRAMILAHTEDEIISVYKRLFGDDIYIFGQLDRRHVSEMLFKNKEMLKEIRDVVDPAVIKDYERWLENRESPFVLFESAILFEREIYKLFDKIIFVSAPEELRKKRVLKRDGISNEQLSAIIATQWKEEEKIPMCDYLIVNDDEKPLFSQVLELYNKIIELEMEK